MGVGVHGRHRADAVVSRDWGSVGGKGQVLVYRMRFALFTARSRRGDAAQPRFVRIRRLSPLFAGPLRLSQVSNAACRENIHGAFMGFTKCADHS
jgi:hypothetical protein